MRQRPWTFFRVGSPTRHDKETQLPDARHKRGRASDNRARTPRTEQIEKKKKKKKKWVWLVGYRRADRGGPVSNFRRSGSVPTAALCRQPRVEQSFSVHSISTTPCPPTERYVPRVPPATTHPAPDFIPHGSTFPGHKRSDLVVRPALTDRRTRPMAPLARPAPTTPRWSQRSAAARGPTAGGIGRQRGTCWRSRKQVVGVGAPTRQGPGFHCRAKAINGLRADAMTCRDGKHFPESSLVEKTKNPQVVQGGPDPCPLEGRRHRSAPPVLDVMPVFGAVGRFHLSAAVTRTRASPALDVVAPIGTIGGLVRVSSSSSNWCASDAGTAALICMAWISTPGSSSAQDLFWPVPEPWG